jgi:hypothetical protein
MREKLVIALVALLASILSNDIASAGSLSAADFPGARVLHAEPGGRLHPGLFVGRGGGGVHEPSLPHSVSSSSQGWWRNEVHNGLTATGLGLLIQSRMAAYLGGLQSQSSSETGAWGPSGVCDAECITSRYLRNTANPSASGTTSGPDVPQYDVDHNCTTLEGIPTRNHCFRVEQENYDILKSLWPNVPGNVKDKTLAKMHDITRGRATVTYPYTMMKGYLVAYLQAAEAARPAEPIQY